MRSRLARATLTALGVASAWTTTFAADSIDMPKRKPGLWQVQTTVDGRAVGGGGSIKQCIDSATEGALREMGRDHEKDCTTREMKQEAGKVVLHSVCKVGESTATTDGTFTGDLTADYRGEMYIRYVPPIVGKAEAKMVVEAKWIGPCDKDQKPGDMILSNGMKVNMNDMSKLPGKLPGRMPGKAPALPAAPPAPAVP